MATMTSPTDQSTIDLDALSLHIEQSETALAEPGVARVLGADPAAERQPLADVLTLAASSATEPLAASPTKNKLDVEEDLLHDEQVETATAEPRSAVALDANLAVESPVFSEMLFKTPPPSAPQPPFDAACDSPTQKDDSTRVTNMLSLGGTPEHLPTPASASLPSPTPLANECGGASTEEGGNDKEAVLGSPPAFASALVPNDLHAPSSSTLGTPPSLEEFAPLLRREEDPTPPLLMPPLPAAATRFLLLPPPLPAPPPACREDAIPPLAPPPPLAALPPACRLHATLPLPPPPPLPALPPACREDATPPLLPPPLPSVTEVFGRASEPSDESLEEVVTAVISSMPEAPSLRVDKDDTKETCADEDGAKEASVPAAPPSSPMWVEDLHAVFGAEEAPSPIITEPSERPESKLNDDTACVDDTAQSSVLEKPCPARARPKGIHRIALAVGGGAVLSGALLLDRGCVHKGMEHQGVASANTCSGMRWLARSPQLETSSLLFAKSHAPQGMWQDVDDASANASSGVCWSGHSPPLEPSPPLFAEWRGAPRRMWRHLTALLRAEAERVADAHELHFETADDSACELIASVGSVRLRRCASRPGLQCLPDDAWLLDESEVPIGNPYLTCASVPTSPAQAFAAELEERKLERELSLAVALSAGPSCWLSSCLEERSVKGIVSGEVFGRCSSLELFRAPEQLGGVLVRGVASVLMLAALGMSIR